MDTKTFSLCFDIDGEATFCEAEKVVYGKTEYNQDIFKLKIADELIVKAINKHLVYYQSKNFFDSLEESIIDLQNQLPDNINIVCCQSCRYGNFCIFGNSDNEIFCLIDFPPPTGKLDLADIFNEHYDELPTNELTDLCEKYQRASDDYYTYNAWCRPTK